MSIDALFAILGVNEDFGTSISDELKSTLLDRLQEKLGADEAKKIMGCVDIIAKDCGSTGFCRGFKAATDINQAIDSYLE